MRQISIDDSALSLAEMAALSLSQIMVLVCLRQLKSREQVARFLRRDEKAIEMIIVRIRKKGISL